MPFVSFLPADAGMPEITQSRPEKMRLFNYLADALMRGSSSFTIGERELIGAFVSNTNDCPYCAGCHTATAGHFDVSESTLHALSLDLETAPVDERLKPVLRYVRKLTQSPHRMAQSDALAVYAAGWDELALSDVVFICGLFNMANRIVEGHGIDRATAREKFDEGGKTLAEFGYVLSETAQSRS
jgi:uncharacterized peroxidase-related enzyme